MSVLSTMDAPPSFDTDETRSRHELIQIGRRSFGVDTARAKLVVS